MPKQKQAVQIDIGGIKCDNPKCDYHDDDAKFEDYLSYVDKPCPHCGLRPSSIDVYNHTASCLNATTHDWPEYMLKNGRKERGRKKAKYVD